MYVTTQCSVLALDRRSKGSSHTMTNDEVLSDLEDLDAGIWKPGDLTALDKELNQLVLVKRQDLVLI